ncbi:MAG TPA: polysaccharide pyruvyl transferase family protein [Bryobacteraceae bacterium]
MGERRWEIGICGTFDVANYGDLLFPLIAEAELAERLGAVTLHRFSYHAKNPPEWPFKVTSVTELPRMIHRLDGLLIGGGFLIRFDKQVAPGYVPPAPEIHHPTGYWLMPALLALQHNVPLLWNAPGMDGNDIPAWANPLMETALNRSRYVSVRDEPSRAALKRLTCAPVAVVPDTAFGLPRLLNLEEPPSAEFTRLCELSGLTGPYIAVQAIPGVEGFVRFIKNHAARFRNFRFLALPIGPAIGDREESIDADLPGVIRLPYWPGPLVLAELIGRSEAVVGHSYHLCITALTSGVPFFALHDLSKGKYAALQHSEGVFVLPPNGDPDLEWFLARMGRTAHCGMAREAYKLLGDHWDRIATALEAEAAPAAPPLNGLVQSLPALLEDAATALAQERVEARERQQEAAEALEQERTSAQERMQQALAAARGETADARKRLDEVMDQLGKTHKEGADRQDRLDDVVKQLTAARVETAARDAQIAEIMTSLSWRLTAPLRFAGRGVLKPRRRPLMKLAHIGHHRLETDPYRWAAIANLFNPDDAARLADTYPCDHFKLVAGYGGEKDYEYEARALIGMGEDVIAFPDDLSDAWRALAGDLLSPEYRAAMTALTGCDLMQAPMEANVFHYGPGHSLGAHRDLPEKLVTQVLYFNRSWNSANGGCLRILRSHNAEDVVAEIPPIVGYSSVIVRSENSWHAVSRVANDSASSRRSVTVTFYSRGSVSTMWPPGDTTPLHSYLK